MVRWPRRLAVLTALLTGVALVVAVVLASSVPTRSVLLTLAVGLAIAPSAALLGVLIARRQPENVVGFLLTLVGLTVATTVTKEIGWHVLAGQPDTVAQLAWLAAVLDQSAFWIIVAVALLLLYFPDGRLPSPRWRWVPSAMIIGTVIDQATTAFDAAPFRPPLQDLPRPWEPLPSWAQAVAMALFIVTFGLMLSAGASQVVRYRRSDTLRRRQIRWLALVGVAVPLYPVLCLLEILVWGEPRWFSVGVGIAGLVGIPIATAVAMLRHDLYDVDRALAATVTYGLVSTVLLTIFAASSFVGGLLLGRDSAVAAAAATAICAIALSPLRRRLQATIDRRLYPARRAALTAVDTLSRDSRVGLAQPERLESVLRDALRDSGLRVGFQLPGSVGYVDADGAPVDPDGAVSVELGGRPIGVITSSGGAVRPELLRQIAAAAATLVEVVRLRLELATALREVESSRARLVRAGYEERRRLERDLHDGAQQRLVSLGMAFRVAQRHLDDGTVDLNGLLDQGVAELGTALAELRTIAYGLRPGRLDDGLDAALAELVRSMPIAVDVDVCTDPVPDMVATTAYYVVSEALTNVVKHAAADRVGLQVARADGRLLVRVSDDGDGGAELSTRSGLVDRVAAVGGTLRVRSPRGGGTTVEAVLPCAS